MSETELEFEYARQKILSGETPLEIRQYRRRRVFWIFFWSFVSVWIMLNLTGALPIDFWGKIIYFLPPFLLLLALRATLVRSAAADIAVMAAGILFLGFVTAYGMLAVNSPLVAYLPANLVKVAAILP